MKSSKLYIPELKKSFQIRHTNKMYRKSLQYSLAVTKSSLPVDDTSASLEGAIKLDRMSMDFVQEVLKLTDEQMDQLDDSIDPNDLQKLAVKIGMLIQGSSDAEIKQTMNDMDDARKSQNEEVNEDGKETSKK